MSNNYPFGMAMPNRKYQAGGSLYRYGFNGQEKSDDVTVGNTTAMYWEYDSRIGRRWNKDPIVKVNESPYLTFGGNPIWFSDANGDKVDSLGVGGSADSRADINSMVSQQNQDFLNYDAAKNILTLKKSIVVNGQTLTLSDATRKDQGLALLDLLVSDSKNYYYSASNTRSFNILDNTGALLQSVTGDDVSSRYSSGTRVNENTPSSNGSGGNAYYEMFANLSFTLRGDEAKNLGGMQLVPNKTYAFNGTAGNYTRKYDGVVTISPGEFYQERMVAGLPVIRKTRSEIVFHELYENWNRVNGDSYQSAHKDAVKRAAGPAVRIGPPNETESLNSGAQKTRTMGESYYFIMK